VVDVFDEVEEQLRSERYQSLAMKSLPWLGALAAVAVIGVGGYWGWTSYQTDQANKASESYQTALETAQKQGPDKAFGQFKAVADGNAQGYKALALLPSVPPTTDRSTKRVEQESRLFRKEANKTQKKKILYPSWLGWKQRFFNQKINRDNAL